MTKHNDESLDLIKSAISDSTETIYKLSQKLLDPNISEDEKRKILHEIEGFKKMIEILLNKIGG